MKKILFIDVETGGLDPKMHSILSIGLVAWENMEIINELEIFIKNDLYRITLEAIEINKIDLRNFQEKSKEPKEAVIDILRFLSENFGLDDQIIIGGHNVNFDVNFLKKFFNANSRSSFDKFFSHRYIDTATILKFLYFADILKEDLSSSDKAFKHFNINVGTRHSSLDDARATANLFTELIKEIKRY